MGVEEACNATSQEVSTPAIRGFFMKLTKEEYKVIHTELAERFKTSPEVIQFVRSLSIQQGWVKKQLEDFILKKLQIKKAPGILKFYNERAVFLNRITEDQFEYILAFKATT